MGDYTKKGEKIGTCGSAYYATKKMIQTEFLAGDHSSDIMYYLNEKEPIRFAFPFPEYDNKKIGEISNFHEGQRIDFFFNFKGEAIHNTITHHVHPKGGQGVNLFISCPCSEHADVSTNFKKDDPQVFRLVSQINYNKDGKLFIAAECIYCNTLNIFDKEEADIICCNILEEADYYENKSKNSYYPDDIRKTDKKTADYYTIIALRIAETYNNH